MISPYLPSCETDAVPVESQPEVPYAAGWKSVENRGQKYIHEWGSRESSIASICIVHGLGEHGERYHRLANDLANAGFWVIAFDQQGHGRSSERRGCIESYDSMLDDIGGFLTWAQSENPNPAVLFGHSMGGNLVLNYTLRKDHQPAAVISSSPMIRAASPPSWLLETFARFFLRIAPNYQLESRVVAERLMDDPKEQSLLLRDELFHSKLSLQLGAALLDSGEWLLGNANKLEVQTLLTHGTSDLKTCHDASIQFAGLAGEKCQLQILEDRMHDPFRDTARDSVVKQFIEFASGVRERAFA